MTVGQDNVILLVLRTAHLRCLFGGKFLPNLRRMARKRYPNDRAIADKVLKKRQANTKLQRLIDESVGPKYAAQVKVRRSSTHP